MNTVTKSFKNIIKFLTTITKIVYYSIVLFLVAVIGYVIYSLYPLYTELKPTIPMHYTNSDKISWQFFRDANNPLVYQKLTIYSDGSNEVEITRKMGDADIDMLGRIIEWKLSNNKELEILKFNQKDILPKDQAARIFKDAIRCGILDISDSKYDNGRKLIIDIEIESGLNYITVTGPDSLTTPITYPPKEWVNRIYWQKITNLINKNEQINTLMDKRVYIKQNN